MSRRPSDRSVASGAGAGSGGRSSALAGAGAGIAGSSASSTASAGRGSAASLTAAEKAAVKLEAAREATKIDVWNPPRIDPAPAAVKGKLPEHKLSAGTNWKPDPFPGETFEEYQHRKRAGATQHPLFATSSMQPVLTDEYLKENSNTTGLKSKFSEYVMRGHMRAPNTAYNITTGVAKSRYHKKLDGILGVGW